MGLREQTKQRNQTNILSIAEDKFKTQGYQQTSMTEIAQEAGVGTGTIYNYFPSKGALLITLLTREMDELRNQTQTNLHNDTGHFMDQLMELIEQSLTFIEHYPKSFWQELLPVLTDQSNLSHQAFELDKEGVEWIEALIRKHADVFIEPIDADQGAYTIYSVMAVQVVTYLFNAPMTYDQLLDNIKQQVHFIFDSKIRDD